MKHLEAEIKKGIYRNIYVLYGPQSYNRKRYETALARLFVPEGDMNCTSFYGKKTDVKSVIDLADTMPFMSEKRVIILENTGLFENKCEELADYIPKIPDSSCLIFSEEKIDARLRQTKEAKNCGCVAEFTDLSEKDLEDWVRKRLGREHRPITKPALDMFIARCGNDLWQVSNELEKVISYTFGKDGIRPEDVDAVCPAPPEDRIFGMIDAVLSHDRNRAMHYYRDLLRLRSDPLSILALIREQYRLMLHIKEMAAENRDREYMAKALSMRDQRIKMALPAARKSSRISLISGIEKCADTDERIKSGLIDAHIGVETLIADLCQ